MFFFRELLHAQSVQPSAALHWSWLEHGVPHFGFAAVVVTRDFVVVVARAVQHWDAWHGFALHTHCQEFAMGV